MYVYLENDFQLNYNYTTKIKQMCSGEILVRIFIISCDFVGNMYA